MPLINRKPVDTLKIIGVGPVKVALINKTKGLNKEATLASHRGHCDIPL